MKSTMSSMGWRSAVSVFGALCLVLGAGLGLPLSAAGVPEPDTVIYGRILNRDRGYELLVTQGELVWTIQPENDTSKSLVLRATVEALGGNYSYRLKVPHEAIIAGVDIGALTAGHIGLEDADQRYRLGHVTVNGVAARILAPAAEVVPLSQGRRLTAHRVDLEVVLPVPDTDRDGTPDWWEKLHGFNPALADSALDPDTDGLTNLMEFLGGTNPRQSNFFPRLVAGNTIIDEGSTEVLQLQAVDADTPPARLTYTLMEEPAGASLKLLFAGTAAGTNGLVGDRPLVAGSTFTQAQVEQGVLVLHHDDPRVTEFPLKLRLSDGDPANPPHERTLLMKVHSPTAVDGTGALVWFDAGLSASEATGGFLGAWRDRSGSKDWLDGTQAPLDATALLPVRVENAGPLGQPVLAFNLPGTPGAGRQAMTIPHPSPASVLGFGDLTVFTVYRSTPDVRAREQLVGGANFQLSVAGETDFGREGQLRFASGTGVTYGNHRLEDQWVLASAVREVGEMVVELNGIRAGGPIPQSAPTALGSVPALGGRVDYVSESGGLPGPVVSDPFAGHLAEVIVFNRALPAEERQRVNFALLSKWFGWVLMDGSEESRDLAWRTASSSITAVAYRTNFVPRYGPDRRYILLGGSGNDVLQGGHNDDILGGGIGTNTLTGWSGRDHFVFTRGEPGQGQDIVNDFRPVEDQDALDLVGLLHGVSRDLRDYVKVRTDGHHSYLDIDFDGGRVFTDRTIVLKNIVIRDENLYALWARTNLVTGDKRFPLPVSISAQDALATEITGETALLTVHFGAELVPHGLEMPFEAAGTADLGVDYRLSTLSYNDVTREYSWKPVVGHEFVVQLRPGDLDLSIRVEPLMDSRTEPKETLRIRLVPVPEYYDLTTAEVTAQIVDGPQRVSVVAVDGLASETGQEGLFQLRREGNIDAALDVRIQMTGPAENGRDYAFVSSTVHFAVGQSEATVSITPRPDDWRELSEAVELVVLPGEGYFPNPARQAATVVIEDSGPVISLAVLESLAVVQDATKGAVLVRRAGLLQDTLTVLLDISGTATMGRDYRRLDRFVTFPPGAASVLVSVEPLIGAVVTGPVETINISVASDAAYAVGADSRAQVRLVSAALDFGRWRGLNFPGDSSPLETFARADADLDGVVNLLEYAFGTNPKVAQGSAVNRPQAILVGGRVGVRFNRPVAAIDLRFVPEVSDDLIGWRAATDEFELIPGPLASDGTETVTWVERLPAARLAHRFIRLQVELQ